MTVVSLNRGGREVQKVEFKRVPGVGNVVIESKEEETDGGEEE